MHYLDNSATTVVSKQAAEKALEIMTKIYGNPSSLHKMGFEAKCELDNAREIIASCMHAGEDEIYFTSGGTESNNLAIFGAAKAKNRFGNKIVTTEIEHPSVLEAINELEKDGYEIVKIKPEKDGNILPEKIESEIDEKTILVSIMMINNETGAVLPVKSAANAIKRKKSPALLHTDAVQAFTKTEIFPKKLGADLITVSGHKVHAPKGVGALYVSKQARILPTIFGGGQEKNLRSGTEGLSQICAFAKAVETSKDIKESYDYIESLNKYLRKELQNVPEVHINSPDNASPYVLNFAAGKVRAETMLHFLSDKDIYVSSGSACGRLKPSHVLEAMNLQKEIIDSSIRVSFSTDNNKEDIDALILALNEGLKTLHY